PVELSVLAAPVGVQRSTQDHPVREVPGRPLALGLDSEGSPVVEPFALGPVAARAAFPLVTDASVVEQVVGAFDGGMAGFAGRAVQREIDRDAQYVRH